MGRIDPPVLSLKGVSKSFHAVKALRSVSLELRAGSIVALCGENGAGKSTLAAIASGLLRPDAGEILIDGEARVFASARDANDAGVRIAPQELVLCQNLTVAENICLGQLPSKSGIVDMARLRTVAHERLEQLGHPIDPDSEVESLSVVDQACVQIARAVAPGVRVLIVDEPTAPMSDVEADGFMHMIKRLADLGIAIVYVSHRLDEVFRLADEIVVLRDGCLVAQWERGQVEHGELVRTMVGDRDLSVEHRRGAALGAPELTVKELSYDIIRDVSLTLHAGEILTVYGIAGSGREHLGQAIVGAVKRRSGQVQMGDAIIGQLRTAIAAGIGFVPAERRAQGLVLERSVGENITLAMLNRLSRATVLRKQSESQLVNEWIGRLRIATSSPDKQVGLLSGGSQQKVLLARWLAAGSRVLVLDEPTRGVDVATKAEIYRLLRQVADNGGAVLVISSDVEEVAAIADRALVLRAGRVAREMVGANEAEIAEAALIGEDPNRRSALDYHETEVSSEP